FGTLPTSGSFTYDASTGFSAFIVQWDGITFNLTSAANTPALGTRSTGCNSRGSTPQYGFIIMDQIATGCDVSYMWGAQSTPPSASFDFQLFDRTAASDDIFLGTNNGSILISDDRFRVKNDQSKINMLQAEGRDTRAAKALLHSDPVQLE